MTILNSFIKTFLAVISTVSLREILDITFVALIIYFILLFVKQTKSYFIVNIALTLFGINLIAKYLNLGLTRDIFAPISTIVIIILVVVFQRELRRFLRWVVYGKQLAFSNSLTLTKTTADEVADAISYMAKNKIGGIFVFSGEISLDDLLEGGQALEGKISKELILSIFDDNSPGHDGAIIIDNNKVKMFGVHLPLARDYTNYRKAGTRHRAATGITEDTDAIALVISEERGEVSIARNGTMTVLSNEKEILDKLKEIIMQDADNSPKHFWGYFFKKNFRTKLAAISIAFVLWFGLAVQTGIVKKEFEIPLSFQLLPASYEIDSQAGKTLVKVTLEGRSTDINTFDATKLEVKVDAKEFRPGVQTININEKMIDVPPYLNTIQFSPKVIYVPVKEKSGISESSE